MMKRRLKRVIAAMLVLILAVPGVNLPGYFAAAEEQTDFSEAEIPVEVPETAVTQDILPTEEAREDASSFAWTLDFQGDETEWTGEEMQSPETDGEPTEENRAPEEHVPSVHAVTFDLEEGEGSRVVTSEGELTQTGVFTAVDGSIVFSVLIDADHELVSVLVDGVYDARKNEATENEDDYIIEGICTDDTVVTVKTVRIPAETEEDTETETETESETETETGEFAEQVLYATIFTDASYSMEAADAADIILSGLMPKGASVKAYPVSVELEGIRVLAAYDISIFDPQGREFEPEGRSIAVQIDNARIREALEEDHELMIYHMESVSEKPQEIATLTEAESAAFSADCFSIYVVGEDEKLQDLEGNPHYVYHVSFFLPAQEGQEYTLVSSQTLSPGEKVEEPGVPDRKDYNFDGWYTQKGGQGDRYDFPTLGNILPEIEGEEDVTLDLYAHYSGVYYVHYMTHAVQEGTGNAGIVFHTEAYSMNEELDTADAEALYLLEGYLSYLDEETKEEITALAVTGWQDAQGVRWQSGDLVAHDLELYPIVEEACWIYFDMNGRSSKENPAPKFVPATEAAIGDLPEPVVSGYSFEGWYTMAEGGEQVSASDLMSDLPKNQDRSITLYAHWSEANVAYTINIWRQKAIDGAAGITSKQVQDGEIYDDYIQYYDYAENYHVSETQSRLKTGDTPSAAMVDNWNTYTGFGGMKDEDSAYFGFEYAGTDAQTRTLNNLGTIRMEADGSTVINIFYNRVTVNWTFKDSGSWSRPSDRETGTLIGLYNTNVTPSDGSAGGGTLSAWPNAGKDCIWEYTYGSGIFGGGTQTVTFEGRFLIMSGYKDLTFTPSSFANANKSVYYYLEVTNADMQVDPGGEKAAEAAGYGISYTKTVEGTPYVYTGRILIQDNLLIESKFIGYEYAGWNNADRDTSFTGTGSSFTGSSNTRFVFNNALKLTITLISGEKVVGVNDAGEVFETDAGTTFTVKYGEDLTKYAFPEKLDGEIWGPAYYYDFTGIWYEDPFLSAPFVTTVMPNNNLVAYADWELKEINVSFSTGTESVQAPETQVIRAAQMAKDPGTLSREGYTHVGWIDQNGRVFNFGTTLYADTMLRAIWKADDEEGYQIRYDLNAANSNGLLDPDKYPNGSDVVVNPEPFAAGDSPDVWTIEETFPELDAGVCSKFVGWNTLADGTGTMIYPGGVIYFDGETTLYAIWEHENKSTLVLDYNYPDIYTGEKKMPRFSRTILK